MSNIVDITERLHPKELSEREIINYRLNCFEEHYKLLYNDLRDYEAEIKRLKDKLKTL